MLKRSTNNPGSTQNEPTFVKDGKKRKLLKNKSQAKIILTSKLEADNVAD